MTAIQLYEQLTSAPDDKTRARIIAEAFARMKKRCRWREESLAGSRRDTERRLLHEIEELRRETARLKSQVEPDTAAGATLKNGSPAAPDRSRP